MQVNPNLPQRRIVRHSSGLGSVITFDVYGEAVELFVADAKYRTTSIWSRNFAEIKTVSNFGQDRKRINPKDSVDDCTRPLDYTVTDAQLQLRFPVFGSDNTASRNQKNVKCYSKVGKKDATYYCEKLFAYNPMVLPNMYELMVIYLEADRLDALDPTVASYPEYALGSINPNGRFSLGGTKFVWSGTVENSDKVCNIYYDGIIGTYFKSYTGGVVPVKELSYSHNSYGDVSNESGVNISQSATQIQINIDNVATLSKTITISPDLKSGVRINIS